MLEQARAAEAERAKVAAEAAAAAAVVKAAEEAAAAAEEAAEKLQLEEEVAALALSVQSDLLRVQSDRLRLQRCKLGWACLRRHLRLTPIRRRRCAWCTSTRPRITLCCRASTCACARRVRSS
jgi:hypothetical protein